ncbi:MAG: 5'-3' exonuclease H3TH domain-containing protein [Candidatus Pacebacteria bacterium]|nr:5'-3' exonuclease H3TH domain-containing protein [Candidatus Paceibacterota bacterium]
MKKLLLIDANSIIHRSFHAIPPFTTPDGKPSGAIYGIASILLKLWREDRPDYAAALFDRPEPTFREEKYAAYKAQRPPAPDELIQQIVEAHKLFEAFGIKTFEKPTFEADDLIATLAEKFKIKKDDADAARDGGENDLQVVILTGDRDTLQLVEDDHVVVQTFNKGVSDTTIYNEKAVFEKYGIMPAQMVDWKALVGDPSDNIKGVPGVGPKTALELLQKFGSVEELFAHVGDDEKIAKRIGPYRAEAELSRELVVLERNVPIGIPPLEALAPHNDIRIIEEYFITMGFATLLKRIYEEKAPKPKPKKEGPKNIQKPLF